RLTSFFVLADGEGGVLCRQTLNSGRQFFLVTLGVRFDSYRDHWFWEFHGFQDDRCFFGRKAVTSGGVLQTDDCVDVAGLCFVNRVFLVGVHLEQPRDTFLFLLGGVQNLIAGLDLARVDPDVGQGSEEWVSSDLECQCGEWLIKAWTTDQFFFWVFR